ncbi:sigma-E factor regulatory protein RseB domain-containing protein [Actinomadura algeriensis]|uniref:Sigma-E factor negative regulatory protein RseB n=1 Tax=Actinomadura algeriensis TaxID=1679523 RepID=A0ABR9JUV4_9ACTN|nr:sigma-E factor regulatory protein RseB domain-containing protein [Actinomadura algeriensis]MBE1534327.1 sigma-E factor negative regulatory protein RseB [Actinomadura algeriensis]
MTSASSAARRRRRAVVTGGIVGALALVVALTGDPVSARRVRSDPGAVGLLRAAADAARRVPYEGARVLTTRSRDRSATSRTTVVHRPGEGIRYTSPSGTSGYRPESAAGETTGFTPATLELLNRNYTVVQVADATRCGRAAHVVEARRADGTLAGRFWLDVETGLMLHRELVDASGHATVSTGFTSISFAAPSGPGEATPPPSDRPTTGTDDDPSGTLPGGDGDAARPLSRRGSSVGGVPEPSADDGATVPGDTAAAGGEPLDEEDLADLRAAGWPVPALLSGGLTLHDARRRDGTLHLGYSDGLEAVSVFVQRGALDEGRMRGWEKSTVEGDVVFHRAALRQWAVSAGDGFVYTVLTDGPSGTAESVARELPGGSASAWARFGRGARRLASAVNPFD